MAIPKHERQLRDAESNGDFSAELAGLDLSGVRMSSPKLNQFNLSGADLRNADLAGAYFHKANLSKANLSNTKICTSDFRDANLEDADLTSANLDGAVMTGANLSRANLSKASLVKAMLNNVSFTGANLEGTDLRGARGLTESQLASAVNSDKAILDQRMLASLNRSGDIAQARLGRKPQNRKNPFEIDLAFDAPKPMFGDLFLLCGYPHPHFPPSGNQGFEQLADLDIEQVDDYFAISAHGDAVVWIYPIVKGRVVHHHPGPFDGIRIELSVPEYKELWTNCVERITAWLAANRQ